MPFPAKAVGADLERAERDMSARSILAYAAGVGAHEAAFLDDAQPGGLRALPFQCVSLEWPALLSLRGALSDLSPQEAVRGVHAVQDSIFHRPVRAGERLVTNGRLVSARRIRAGVLTVCRLETRTSGTGEPVTTSWSSSIYRDVALDGDEVALAAPPQGPGAEEPLAQDAARSVVAISRGAPHVYSECADIWNPIHTERVVALAAGLPDIILHGTATWALAGLEVLRQYAACDVGRMKRLSGRFTGMVMPGESITLRHASAGPNLVQFEVLTPDGRAAISQGFAELS